MSRCSPAGEMVVSSTTSQMSSSPDVEVDEPEVEEEVVRFNPPPPPAHSSSHITTHSSTLSTNNSNILGYSIAQPSGSILSHGSQQLSFRLSQEVPQQVDTGSASRRFYESHQEPRQASSTPSPPTPDPVDIDSTTTDHHHAQYSSSLSGSSSRLLSTQSPSVSLPSYSEQQQQMQVLQSHLQSSYFDNDLNQQQHMSGQISYSTSNSNSGSGSAATAAAVQQLQQLLLQTSSSSLPSDLTQQGQSNTHVYTQSHHHSQPDFGHSSESSQQQIIRLYHHLQESAASLSSHALENNQMPSQMETSTHLNNSLHHSWHSQQLLPHQQSHQIVPSELDLNDYEDDDEDNQGLDLVAPPAHMRSVVPQNTSSSSHHLHHHHFLLPNIVPVSEGPSGVSSHPLRSFAPHEQQQLIEEDLEQETEGVNAVNQVDQHGIDVDGSADEIIIADVPVESRARASLPSAYLFIDIVMDINEEQDLSEGFNSLSADPVIYGVFARKVIPERTQFGPVEGVISKINSQSNLFNQHQQNLIVFISDSLILDQSDENKSNWMRFVRSANSASTQNLILVTKEQTQPNPDNVQELITTTKFYFMTTKPISPREELRVWYSKEYAERFRLKLLEDDTSLSRQHHQSSSRASPTDLSMFRSTASAPPTISSNHHFFSNTGQLLGAPSQLPSLSHRLSHQESHPVISGLNAASHVLEQQHSQARHSEASSYNVHNAHHNQLSSLGYLSSPHHSVQQQEQNHYQSQTLPSQSSLTTLDPVPLDFNMIPSTQPSSSHSNVSVTPQHNTYLRQDEHQYQEDIVPSLPQTGSSERITNSPTERDNSRLLDNSTVNVETNSSSNLPNAVPESPSASLIPATPPSASGGHKLRNKIAKTQQQQQLQMMKLHRSLDCKVNDVDGSSKPLALNQPLNSKVISTAGSSSHQHKCDVCGKSFNRFYSLRRHQIMHSGEKKYKCPVCNMSFSHVYNRNRHVKRHANRSNGTMRNKQLRQSQTASSKTNQTEQQLENLIESTESIPLEGNTVKVENNNCSTTTTGKILMSNNPNRPFKCSQCYKCFTTEDRLIKHALVHSGDDRQKPFPCHVCNKRFLNNSALSCHLKMHETPKDQPRRYDCIFCDKHKLFETNQERKQHFETHRDPTTGKFSCTHCQKKFEKFTAVRKHIRAFHSDREYPCPVCNKIFPRPDKLKLHMLKHSDHREFLCQTCGKQFKRKDKLKEHISRMHAPDREAKLAMKAAAKAAAVEAATAQLRAAVESASAVIASSTNQPTSSNIPDKKGKGRHGKAMEQSKGNKKFIPKVSPSDYHRFVYKCHSCQVGFKRRGMLVNHLAKRHPETPPDAVPELNLPILKTTRDYFCQYCDKVYKSSSKRKMHILKIHPGKSLPLSNRHKGGVPSIPGVPNPTFSAPVGAVHTNPHYCNWCFKQYASKAKLLQHHRKKHSDHNPSGNSSSTVEEKKTNEHEKIVGSKRCFDQEKTPLPTQEEFVDHLAYVTTSTAGTANHSQSNQNPVDSCNLMSLLGSFASSGESNSSVAADLQELLQSHSSTPNDILNQAMAEFTNNSQHLIKQNAIANSNTNHEHQVIPSSEANAISTENDLSFT